MVPQTPISLPFWPFPVARVLDGPLMQSGVRLLSVPSRSTTYITHRDAGLAEEPEQGFSETAWKDPDVKVLS